MPVSNLPATRYGRLPERLQREFRKITWRFRSLPDFLVIGCQKGGTSSLHGYLSQHPRLQPADVKEVHFFDGGLHPGWDKYVEGERLYRSYFGWRHFLHAQGRQSFEASPCYMFNPLGPARMAAMVPDARLIVLLRDPVERAVSHYFHERRRGREILPILEALQSEADRLAPVYASGNYKDERWINFSYVTRGLYAEQLERLFEHYPRERVLILESSEFYTDPKQALSQVLGFVGVDYNGFNADLTPVGVGNNREKVDSAVYDWLSARFIEPNARLEDLLGRRFDWCRR